MTAGTLCDGKVWWCALLLVSEQIVAGKSKQSLTAKQMQSRCASTGLPDYRRCTRNQAAAACRYSNTSNALSPEC